MPNHGQILTDPQVSKLKSVVESKGMSQVLREIALEAKLSMTKTVIENATKRRGVSKPHYSALLKYLASCVTCPEWVAEVLGEDFNDPLRVASKFTMNLRIALGKHRLASQRVAFINHTGQWLKPVLKKLVNNYEGVIEVYVADPVRTNAERTCPDYVHVLGVLEFFWSLPTSLSLHDVRSNAVELRIFTYDGTRTLDRVAYFEKDMVAISPTTKMGDTSCARGHPGFVGEVSPVQGPETVYVYHSSSAEFPGRIDEWRRRFAGGEEILPGLTQRVTWKRTSGFTGFLVDGTDGFCIEPVKVFEAIAVEHARLKAAQCTHPSDLIRKINSIRPRSQSDSRRRSRKGS